MRRVAGSGYRGRSGQWSFVGHRVSGFLVFFFLLLHIVDVSLIRWPSVYDEVHQLYGNVFLRIFEVGLLFALVFHAFNGLRIVAIDLLPGAMVHQNRLLKGVIILTVLLGLSGGAVIMAPFIAGYL
ncbi:MAG: succinate dehydrogenase, cytochrome b556 subunit [Pseudonocardiaceae bacterium]